MVKLQQRFGPAGFLDAVREGAAVVNASP